MRMISALSFFLLGISAIQTARADSSIFCKNIRTFISEIAQGSDGVLSYKEGNKEIFAVKPGEDHEGVVSIGLRVGGHSKWVTLNASRVAYIIPDRYDEHNCGVEEYIFSDGVTHATSLNVKVCWIGNKLIRKAKGSSIEKSDWYSAPCN